MLTSPARLSEWMLMRDGVTTGGASGYRMTHNLDVMQRAQLNGRRSACTSQKESIIRQVSTSGAAQQVMLRTVASDVERRMEKVLARHGASRRDGTRATVASHQANWVGRARKHQSLGQWLTVVQQGLEFQPGYSKLEALGAGNPRLSA